MFPKQTSALFSRIRFLISTLSLVTVVALHAQEAYSPPKVPAKAQRSYEQAVLLAAEGRTAEGIRMLEDLIRQQPDWLEPREALARAQYEQGNRKDAIQTIESSLAIDTLSQLRLLVTLARLYEETDQWKKAEACYTAVVRKGIHEPALTAKASAGLQALEEKQALSGGADAVEFVPLPDGINTPAHEALGRWSLDGKQLMFTRRESSDEDIYFATMDSLGRATEILPWSLNTPQNEGAHAISPDGRYLIYTACNMPDGSGSCDLYMATKRSIHWAQPRNLGAPVNGPSWEGQPCFGLDGMTLFFSSNRPGGYGGRDIWYSTMRAPGKWTVPLNAGAAINTAADEESPYSHFDGATLYFMRNGKDGLGGYDLYISRKLPGGAWSRAENMGAPINTGADEGALSLHPDGIHAVITRMTEKNKNDLFQFVLPEKFRAAPTQALDITLLDAVTRQPLKGRVEIFEITEFDTARLSQESDEQGQLTLTLRKHREYGLLGQAPGYLPVSITLIANDAPDRRQEILLQPVTAEPATIVFENILFATGSAELAPAAEVEIRRLYELLAGQPGVQAEILGHTDDAGDGDANQQLSEARARAVRDALIGRGIDPARLSSKGLGETQPVADNTTAAGRRKNRRTEVRLVRHP